MIVENSMGGHISTLNSEEGALVSIWTPIPIRVLL
jgi:hypothetical protein